MIRNSPQISLEDIDEESPVLSEGTDLSSELLSSDSPFLSSDLSGTESLLTSELAAFSEDFSVAQVSSAVSPKHPHVIEPTITIVLKLNSMQKPDYELFSPGDQSVQLTGSDDLFAPDESLFSSSFSDENAANVGDGVDTIGSSWQDFVV